MFVSKETKQQNKTTEFLTQRRHGKSQSGDSVEASSLPESTHFLQRNLGNSYLQSALLNRRVSENAAINNNALRIQRKCSCGGSCGSCAGKEEEKIIQTKLEIGPANDVYEQEADRVAEQVIKMPATTNLNSIETIRTTPNISKYPGGVTTNTISCQVEEEEKYSKEDLLSLKEIPGTRHEMSNKLETQIESLGEGEPLSPDVREFFEPRFGHKFSQVRFHTNSKANQTAQALNARAYTLGHDIVFAAGEYRPKTQEGKRLIAHELTHVIQQRGQVQTVMRHCDCSSVGARNPTAGEESFLSGHFPNLVSGEWCVTAPATPTYNCFAWSIGDTSQWIDKDVDKLYGDNDGNLEFADFDSFYDQTLNLSPATDYTPMDPFIVLYGKGGAPTHAAATSGTPCKNATFESKLGRFVRILHDPYQLEGGPTYGDLNRYYE